jgi:DNA polymerase zeta
VESILLRLAKPRNYILFSPSRQEVNSQNAPEAIPLVLEPQSRYYTDPVIVFDFRSLYPSIMIAYNLCYSSCLGRLVPGQGEANEKKFGAMEAFSLPRGLLETLRSNIDITPNGVLFVQSELRHGLLPRYELSSNLCIESN